MWVGVDSQDRSFTWMISSLGAFNATIPCSTNAVRGEPKLLPNSFKMIIFCYCHPPYKVAGACNVEGQAQDLDCL